MSSKMLLICGMCFVGALVIAGLPHEVLAQATYTPQAIQDPGASPVDFDTMKTFMFSTFGKAMGAGMGIAGVFLGVRKLWSWLVRA